MTREATTAATRVVRILGDLKARQPFYQSRKLLRDQLVGALQTPHQIVTLMGPVGSGKTTEALAYVHEQIYAAINYDLVVWIDCEDFTRETKAIERELELPVGKKLYSYLLSYPGRWLLVLDNANNTLPPLPASPKGHIIVCSYEANWPNAIRMGKMERSDSAALITSILNKPVADLESQRLIMKIAEELDDHPLAMETAALEMVSSNITIGDYYKRLIAQILEFFPTKACSESFVGKITSTIDDLSADDSNAYRLLQYLSHLTSAFIPREWIYKLMKLINPLEHEQRADLALLKLKQYGLIEAIAYAGEPVIIVEPVILALRIYFASKPHYRDDLWIIADHLRIYLDEANSNLQFYYMHARALINRLLKLRQSGEEKDQYEQLVEHNFHAVCVEKLCHPDFLGIDLTTTTPSRITDDNLLTLIQLFLAFVKDLVGYDEVDAAYFYCLILQQALEKKFTYLSLANCISLNIDDQNFQQNWMARKRHYQLCQEVLFERSRLEFRRLLKPSDDEKRQALTLSEASISLSFKLINYRQQYGIYTSTEEFSKLKALFFKVFKQHLYVCVRAISMADPYPTTALTIRNTPNEKAIFMETEVPNALPQRVELMELDTQKNEITIYGVPDGRFVNPLIIRLKYDYKKILSFYLLMASIAKKRDKYLHWPVHFQNLLAELKMPDVILKKVITDIHRKEDNNVNDILALLRGYNGNLYAVVEPNAGENLQQAFNREKLAILAELRSIKTYFQPGLETMTDVALSRNERLNRLSQRLRRLLPASTEVHSNIIYESSIRFLKEGHEYYRLMVSGQEEYLVIHYYLKIAKHYVRQYRMMKENGITRKSVLRRPLLASLEYYEDVKRIYQKKYQRDEPILEVVDYFLGMLDLAGLFKAEGINPPSYLTPDKLKDYFLRCRFILSQMYNRTFSLGERLFLYGKRLGIIHKDLTADRHSIFDVEISTLSSRDYYEDVLRKVEQKYMTDPTNIKLRYARAVALLNLGMYPAAIHELTEYLVVYPHASTALGRRGFANYKLANYAQALADFEAACEIHGNRDSLIKHYQGLTFLALRVRTIGIDETIPNVSRIAIFIEALQNRFAIGLQRYIEVADGSDPRLTGSDVAGRIVKATDKLLPTSVQAFGFGADVPLGEVVDELVNTVTDAVHASRKYKADKVARTTAAELKANKIKDSEGFKKVAHQLANTFKSSIIYLKYKGVQRFADYLANSMLDYLGSDRLNPSLPIEGQLYTGAVEGYRSSYRWLANEHTTEGWRRYFEIEGSRRWRAQGLVAHANMQLPDGRLFSPPGWWRLFREPFTSYPPISGTEEEARTKNYELIMKV